MYWNWTIHKDTIFLGSPSQNDVLEFPPTESEVWSMMSPRHTGNDVLELRFICLLKNKIITSFYCFT